MRLSSAKDPEEAPGQPIRLAPPSKFPVVRALAGDGGIQECGFAQNCVEDCPKQLPLTDSISTTSREAMLQQLKDLFTH